VRSCTGLPAVDIGLKSQTLCLFCGVYAQVRESTGPSTKNSPFMEDLLKAQEAAQSANKGLWTKVGSAGFVVAFSLICTGLCVWRR
jgi:hypothetical protein